MKILMLTELYPPFIGGSEQYVRNLSLGLVERGHEVSVATLAGEGMAEHEIDGGVAVTRLRGTTQRASGVTTPSGRPYAPPFPDPEVAIQLRRIVERENPDVVHAHNWMVRSFLPSKAESGAALVITLHDYGLVCAKRSLMYRNSPCSGPGFSKCMHCAAADYGTARGMTITLGNWATAPVQNRAVDMYVPVSTAVAKGNELAEQKLPFQVVPNFVPDDVAGRSDPAHPALEQLPDEPFWLFVGTLSRHKGVDVLLEAYKGIAGAPPLVLIGPRWHDTPHTFPLGTIVLHDLPHDAVMAAMARAQLVVVPSVFPDPCPTVAIEAMAVGLPVVGSRIGGLPDIVDEGVTGSLVAVRDATALRAALVEMERDQAGRKRMAKAARQRATSFMASCVIDRLEAIYATVA